LAAVFRSGGSVVVSQDEIIKEDLYISGGTIEINGDVKGDLIVGGGVVKVNGNVEGDLIASGGSISLSGNIKESARLAAGNIEIQGDVGRDLVIFSGNGDLTKEALVGQDLIFYGGNLNVAGDIGQNLRGSANSVTIAGQVDKNVTVNVESLNVHSTAIINGHLTYKSSKKANIESGAQIKGRVTHKLPSKAKSPRLPSFLTSTVIRTINFFLAYLAALLLGLLLLLTFPAQTKKIADKIGSAPFKTIAAGFITLAVLPIAAILIAFTIIGLPLSILTLFYYLTLLYMGKIFVGLFVGEKLFGLTGKTVRPAWALTTGLLTILLLGLVPYLGYIVRLLYILFGIGTITTGLIDLYKEAQGLKFE
jgi:cytoskeletal protein CcmA (bactofilin family)